MSERSKRIKAFIKKGQPKVSKEHFDWSQFENKPQFKEVHQLIYNEKSDTYKIKNNKPKVIKK